MNILYTGQYAFAGACNETCGHKTGVPHPAGCDTAITDIQKMIEAALSQDNTRSSDQSKAACCRLENRTHGHAPSGAADPPADTAGNALENLLQIIPSMAIAINALDQNEIPPDISSILEKTASGKEESLSAEEIAMPQELFSKLDTDGNGRLSGNELETVSAQVSDAVAGRPPMPSMTSPDQAQAVETAPHTMQTDAALVSTGEPAGSTLPDILAITT